MQPPRTTLEQWAVLAAVVDAGSFAAAAEALHRSQPAVSYAVARLQQALDVPLLAATGRRSVLTDEGRTLLKRARVLLQELHNLEQQARALKQGWEAELDLVVDAAFPRERLLRILLELRRTCPQTQVRLTDAVLSGAEDAIVDGRADVVVTTRVPHGHLGDALLDIDFLAVAHPDHALLKLDRPLTTEDLAVHPQVVIRDSGTRAPRDEGWLGAQQQFNVTSMDAALATVLAGLTYAWLPEHLVAEALRAGALVRLPLSVGGSRKVSLQLVLVKPALAGPATRAAARCFREIGAAPG